MILTKIRKVIKRYAMLTPGDRVVVALSGGPDSVALLAVLRLLAPEFDCQLTAAHLNHGLRPESAAEERFVTDLCAALHVPLDTENAEVGTLRKSSGRSTEDAAREARYAFLKRTAAKRGAQRIALGHHRRDQAETVLMNLLRGSGTEGLRGMAPVRDGLYIRPLIHIGRDEIISFLDRQGLAFVTDASNDDVKYLRNRIRHELLPLLKEKYNRNVEQTLARTAAILKAEDEYLQEQAWRLLDSWGINASPGGVTLEVEKLRRLPEALSRRIIKELLEGFAHEEKGIFFPHIEAVMGLITSQRPAGCVHLPFSLEARREYGRLLLYRVVPVETGDFQYPAVVPGEVFIPETGDLLTFTLVAACDQFPEGAPEYGGRRERRQTTPDDGMICALLDYDRIGAPLTVRNFRSGDRMRPLGMTGTRKVHRIFIDRKVTRTERRRLPLLVAGDRVLWIPGVCMHDEVKITGETKSILQVTYRRPAEKSC